MTKVTAWGVRALGIAGLGVAAGLVKAARGIPSAMGGTAEGERRARMEASPHFRDGRFHNEAVEDQPSTRTLAGTARELARGAADRKPTAPVPLVRETHDIAEDGLYLTWLGHSTALVEIDGVSVLLDPVWSDRVSPSQQVGPKRLHPNPIELDALPRVDAVVISHDHYDHLDEASIRWLAAHTECTFVVPLGVGAHLAAWGVPEARIEDLDWDEDTKVGDLRLVATQAQHFSGRGFARDSTQWASWALLGPEHRVFYSGDGGYFAGFARIGERHGPFDLTLVQVGAYDGGWPTIHMTPEQGVATHLDVGGRVLVPVHWATFNLAFHPWAEPVERLLTEAEQHGVTVVVPRPGQRFDVGMPPALDPWWRPLAR
jgi:L-ascorbate metabolism protein UlaG (beta-lactamase superfamily)